MNIEGSMSKQPKASDDNTQTLQMVRREGESEHQTTARLCLAPELRGAISLASLGTGISNAKLNVGAVYDELERNSKAASNGDLSRPEAILSAQANVLDALFHSLMRRSQMNMGEYLGAAESYMRLALKAQSQCRATLETLAELRQPRAVAFVTQANISNGPQQVNNAPPSPSRVEEIENQPNKLLEPLGANVLDSRTSRAAIAVDQVLDALEKVDGTANDRG